jgi:hypothetical protein
VEDANDLEALRGAGVTLGQGFLFSKPIPRPVVDDFGQAWRSGASEAASSGVRRFPDAKEGAASTTPPPS